MGACFDRALASPACLAVQSGQQTPMGGGTARDRHMDSLTHGLLGAAIAEAGFRPRLGRAGTLLGAGLAILPDFDFVVKFVLDDPFATLRHHRAETHSLPVLTLVAPFLAWGIWRLRRRRERFRDWWLMTWFVLLSASLLDACTTYGTQLLAPFTRHRFSWDCISIIDVFYSLPLLLAFVLAMVPRIPAGPSQRIAAVVLLLTTLYIGVGVWNRRQVIDIVRTLPVYAGIPANTNTPDAKPAASPAAYSAASPAADGSPRTEERTDVLATPCFSTIWLWRVVTRTRTGSEETQRIYLVSAWTGRIVGQESPVEGSPRFAIRTGIQPLSICNPGTLRAAESDPAATGSAPVPPAPVDADSRVAPGALADPDSRVAPGTPAGFGSEPEASRLPDLSPPRGARLFAYATRTVPHPPPPSVRHALEGETGRLLQWFSNGWLTWEVEAGSEGGTDVFLYDLRYGTAGAPARTPFAWVLRYNADGGKESVNRLHPWNAEGGRIGWAFIRHEWQRTWRLTWQK